MHVFRSDGFQESFCALWPTRNRIRFWFSSIAFFAVLVLSGCDFLSTDPDVIVLELSEAVLDFGEVDLSTSKDLTLEVRNSSNSNGKLDFTLALTGPGFSIVSGGGAVTLAKGQQTLVTLRFTPGSEGISSGNLIVTHNATDAPSPASVSLVGVGRHVIEISLSRATIPFGTVPINEVRDETFAISNSASSTGSLGGTVTGGSSGFSIISGEGSFSISPGQSQEVTVRFAPTQALPYAGSVSITHNASNTLSPSSVTLIGVASHVVEMSLSRTTIPFGTVPIDQAGEETFLISNSASSTGSLNGSITENDTDFSIVNGGESFSIAPGQSRTVTVRFAPSSIGATSGSVSIGHNATNMPTPSLVSLSGTGSQVILMSLNETSVGFGTVAIDQAGEETFLISNFASSTSSLSGSIAVSGSEFSIISGGGSFSISPGQSRTVTVRFAPKSVGTKSGSVSISHNATNMASPTPVALSGIGSQPILFLVDRTSIEFGTVPMGQVRDETFTIRNFAISASPLSGNITAIGSEFSIVSGGGAFSLAPGQARTVTVRFAPTSTGTKSGSVSISHNATSTSSPTPVALSGTEGQWILMSLDETSIDFGTVSVDQTRDEAFTISNSASSTSTLSGDVTEGSSGFSIVSGGGPFSILPGQSWTVTVRFAPTSVGADSGSVSISHNAGNMSSPTPVALSGTGSQPILMSLDKPSVGFGNVPVNQTGDETFLISNSASSTSQLSGSISVSGTPFSIVTGGEFFSLYPGQSWVVTVRFAPTVLGADSGSVSISHNATNMSSPTLVALSGAGGQPILMSLDKSSIGFGDVPINQTEDGFFLISNSASSIGSLSGNIVVSGSGFSITSGGGPFLVPPGQTWVVVLRFAPTSVGVKSGSVSITHNAGNMSSPTTVGLTGTGTLTNEVAPEPTERSEGTETTEGPDGTAGDSLALR